MSTRDTQPKRAATTVDSAAVPSAPKVTKAGKKPTKRAAAKTASKKPTTRSGTAKRSPAKEVGTKKQSGTDSSSNATKDRLSLIALSPYRFPLDIERVAVHSARVAGFAFVFLGLVFTYNYLETTTSDLVVEATQMASAGAVVSCDADCARSVTRTPNATFGYAFNDAAKTYTITLDVPKAEGVDLYAYEVRTATYHRLGTATNQGENSFTYTWNTRPFVSGDYWIKAVITNRHGMYDRSDTTFIQVP